ncbi:MAG: flagellar basal body rod protein FlgC [Planctomycetota bacterium]|nr:flagellar basal body rod protein FlgC [Planctomycetota bacterium]
MYGVLDISTGGMVAQRARMTAISANLANRNSVMPDGTPYRAKHVFLAPGDPGARDRASRSLGVHVARIADDQSPFRLRWDPSHPLAVREGAERGYVRESNVNPIVEQVNAIQAARAYEANVAAAEATKAMLAQALRLVA